MRSKLLLAAGILISAASIASVASATGLTYYPYPFTGPTIDYSNITDGFSYSGFNPSQYTDLYWTVDADTSGQAPCVGIDNCTSPGPGTLTYNSALSAGTLASGVEYFTGSGGSLGTYAELVVTTSAPLIPASSVPYSPGVPTDDGGVVHVTGDFTATFNYLISTGCSNPSVITTCSFGNADSIYSTYEENNHLNDEGYQENENSAFYYSPPVPLPPSVWLMLSGLGGLGFLGRKRLSA